MNQRSLQNLKPKWTKGVSGNPRGKPKGSLNIKTKLLNDLYNGDKPRMDEILQSLYSQAQEGNLLAIKMVFDLCDKFELFDKDKTPPLPTKIVFVTNNTDG